MHATLADYITDVFQNSLEAGARAVDLEIVTGAEELAVSIGDDGRGMDAAQQARAWSPFYSEAGKHARRRVGLGLPLLKQAVEAAGGRIALDSEPGRGTRLRFSLDARHVDAPPPGDLAGTLLGLMAFDGDYALRVTRRSGERSYTVTRQELLEALGDLREASNLALAREYLRGQETDLMNGERG